MKKSFFDLDEFKDSGISARDIVINLKIKKKRQCLEYCFS